MTGSLAPGAAAAGRHTLMNRQSSDEYGAMDPPARWKPACAQSAPNLLASRTPSHVGAGCGGRQRKSPTGAAAYGIPLKVETSPSVAPRTMPDAVRTVGPALEAASANVVTADSNTIRQPAYRFTVELLMDAQFVCPL